MDLHSLLLHILIFIQISKARKFIAHLKAYDITTPYNFYTKMSTYNNAKWLLIQKELTYNDNLRMHYSLYTVATDYISAETAYDIIMSGENIRLCDSSIDNTPHSDIMKIFGKVIHSDILNGCPIRTQSIVPQIEFTVELNYYDYYIPPTCIEQDLLSINITSPFSNEPIIIINFFLKNNDFLSNECLYN